MAKHSKDFRISLAVFIWIQAWLSVPWLASELPLPGPLGHYYVWNKVWAALLLPGLFSLLALTYDLTSRRLWIAHLTLALGAMLDAFYFFHHLPPPSRFSVTERWVSAACSLGAVTWAIQSAHDIPGLEILAALTLLLTFAAGPGSALALSGSVLVATMLITRARARRPPST